MKCSRLLPVALAATVGTELVTQSLREGLPENPHVENESVDAPPHVATPMQSATAGGGQEPLGRFRWRILYREMRKSALKKNRSLAMQEAFLTTARAMVRDRHLLEWQRVMQYNCLKYEMGLIHGRTRGCVNCFGALPAVAVALGVPNHPRLL